MSKELEALQRIQTIIELNVEDYFYWEEFGITIPLHKEEMINDLNLIREALKRNEPMKPNYGGKFPECPVCRKLLHSIWQKHCDNCTQAIDWSDDK